MTIYNDSTSSARDDISSMPEQLAHPDWERARAQLLVLLKLVDAELDMMKSSTDARQRIR